MVKEVKAVIFDIGEVLLLGDRHSKKKTSGPNGPHEEVCKKLDLTMDQYFNAVAPVFQKSSRGEISYKETTGLLSRNLGLKKSEIKEIYSKAQKNNLRKNSELIKEAKHLKGLGYKTAILSDQWHMSRDANVKRITTNDFDQVLISCDEGMRKPEERFFKLALKKLKVKPSETLFIDDQKWNTQTASKLGIQTILFKNNKQLFKQPKWKRLFKNE